ncbi:MAG: hypothetical protein ACRED5_16115 [Propylenella sp.]
MRLLISAVVLTAVATPVSAFAESAPAALLTQIRGAVLVDAGEGFAPASENLRLKVGDRVMVTKDGQAVLSYGGDCSVPLQAPSLTTVEETACATATQGAPANNGAFLAMSGGTVLGGLALTGAALAGDDGTPVSP